MTWRFGSFCRKYWVRSTLSQDHSLTHIKIKGTVWFEYQLAYSGEPQRLEKPTDYVVIIRVRKTSKFEVLKYVVPEVKSDQTKHREFLVILKFYISRNSCVQAGKIQNTPLIHGPIFQIFIYIYVTFIITRNPAREDIQDQSSVEGDKRIWNIEFNNHHRILGVLFRSENRVRICRIEMFTV
jgi:hypothetical protein